MDNEIKLLGLNTSKANVERMKIALSLHPWNNTEEEKRRLEATRKALRNWPKFEEARAAKRKRIQMGVG